MMASSMGSALSSEPGGLEKHRFTGLYCYHSAGARLDIFSHSSCEDAISTCLLPRYLHVQCLNLFFHILRSLDAFLYLCLVLQTGLIGKGFV